MIVTKLMGGMGNQMFQYAFAKHLATKHNVRLKIDTSFLLDRIPREASFVYRNYDLDIFNLSAEVATPIEIAVLTHRISNEFANKLLNKLIGRKHTHVFEPQFNFSEKCFSASANSYLEGYWQTEKYFKPIETLLSDSDFSFKNPMSPNAFTLSSIIQSSNAICVNIRRGDFVNNDFHGAVGVDYYRNAETIIGAEITDPHYFIFSDDMDWCTENITFSGNVTHVDHKYAGNKFQDYLRLMTICKHFIIPNSSFAWWAAWLNASESKMVIAPKKWFNNPTWDTCDIIPNKWIKI